MITVRIAAFWVALMLSVGNLLLAADPATGTKDSRRIAFPEAEGFGSLASGQKTGPAENLGHGDGTELSQAPLRTGPGGDSEPIGRPEPGHKRVATSSQKAYIETCGRPGS